MLTFEALINYLNIPQKKIVSKNVNIKYDTISLPHSILNINNEFENYYYIKDNNNICSFLHSIMTILDKDFIFSLNKNKEIIDLRKKLCFDLEYLYRKFGYVNKRNIKKDNIQKQLLDINHNFDEIIEKYVVDYFGLNIFIFVIENDNLIDIINYMANNDEINIYKPTILLIKINNKYFPILNKNNEHILLYSKNKLVQNLYQKYCKYNIEKKYILKPIKKMLLKELQDMAIGYNISIYKVNIKNNKENLKTKSELYEEISKYI